MQNQDAIQIKKLKLADLPLLRDFFLAAYGSATVFQEVEFLKWYFFDQAGLADKAAGSIFALDTDQNKIVSFYGGLSSEMEVNNYKVPLIWGVNAFTLPAYRGMGLNKKLISEVIKETTTHAVIGFTPKAAAFYKQLEYNLFDNQRFARFVFVLYPDKVKAVQKHLNFNSGFNFSQQVNSAVFSRSEEKFITRLTTAGLAKTELDFACQVAVTTHRSKEFIRSRFLENPFIGYHVFAFGYGNKMSAYIACRAEALEPTGVTAYRVIDLYGTQNGVTNLLRFIIKKAAEYGHAYLDFSVFGTMYDNVFQSLGFSKLQNDEYALLPQVSAPVEHRPNLEYAGIKSSAFSSVFQQLTIHDVYFTRSDSDRDRIARISQLPEKQLAGE